MFQQCALFIYIYKSKKMHLFLEKQPILNPMRFFVSYIIKKENKKNIFVIITLKVDGRSNLKSWVILWSFFSGNHQLTSIYISFS